MSLRGCRSSGYRTSGCCSCGYRTNGCCSIGYRTNGCCFSEYRTSGCCSSGYRTSGCCSSGYRTSGCCSSGYRPVDVASVDIEVAVLVYPSPIVLMVSVDVKHIELNMRSYNIIVMPTPGPAELWNCEKVEVACARLRVPNYPYYFCARKATLNLKFQSSGAV